MDSPVRLRPHHGLCLQFFTGKGYSSGFVENMKAVCAKLEANPHTKIVLCAGPDDLCKACPHNLPGGCRSGSKPARYDEKCLSACGFSIGDDISWDQFQEKLRDSALKCGENFARICSDCVWFSVCQQLYVENLFKPLKTTEIVQTGIFYRK